MNMALVGVIMGSDSDRDVMQGAIDVLNDFGVEHEVRIVSAHRTPDVMYEYARTAADRGLRVIIAATTPDSPAKIMMKIRVPAAGLNDVMPSSRSARTTHHPKSRPITRPRTVPSSEITTDSHRIIDRTCRRPIPTDRRSPISLVR